MAQGRRHLHSSWLHGSRVSTELPVSPCWCPLQCLGCMSPAVYACMPITLGQAPPKLQPGLHRHGVFPLVACWACPVLDGFQSSEHVIKISVSTGAQDAATLFHEERNKEGALRRASLNSKQGNAETRREIADRVSQLQSRILDSSPDIM